MHDGPPRFARRLRHDLRWGLRPADASRYLARRCRPRRVDWAVAVGGVLLQLLAPQTGQAAAGGRPTWLGALALVFAVGQGLPLAWRRLHGYLVAGVVLGRYGGYVLAVGLLPPFAGWVVIWSLATAVAERRRAMLAALAAAGVTCALIVAGELARSGSDASALLSLVTVIVVLAAVLVRSERSRLDAAREHAVAEERLRISGDLHDLVGHGLSTVAVQSSAARMALDAGDEQTARSALAAVESTSRAAMRELRRLLGCCGMCPARTSGAWPRWTARCPAWQTSRRRKPRVVVDVRDSAEQVRSRRIDRLVVRLSDTSRWPSGAAVRRG